MMSFPLASLPADKRRSASRNFHSDRSLSRVLKPFGQSSCLHHQGTGEDQTFNRESRTDELLTLFLLRLRWVFPLQQVEVEDEQVLDLTGGQVELGQKAGLDSIFVHFFRKALAFIPIDDATIYSS